MSIKESAKVPETGQTSPLAGKLIVAIFAFIIAVPMPLQMVFERQGKTSSGDNHIQAFDLFRYSKDTNLLTHLEFYQQELETRSVVSNAVGPRVQWAELRMTGRGNQKVIPGHDEWLFYRPGLRCITGRSFEPPFSLRPNQQKPLNSELVPTIVHFHELLKARGIELVIAPVPMKPSIYPEKLAATYDERLGPPQNEYLETFYDVLRTQGVRVLDLTEELWQHRHEADLCLRMDTHWSPDGMSLFATTLASRLRSQFPFLAERNQPYTTRAVSVSNHGDIFDLLSLPNDSRMYEPQEVTIEQVIDSDGKGVLSDYRSPIVLLGDSSTNIFSLDGLEWGSHAGLGEHLALHLGQSIHCISVNAGGPAASREQLATYGLEGKKPVIWQITVRDLIDPETAWRQVEFPTLPPVPDSLYVKAKIVKLTRPLQPDEDFIYPDTTTHTLYRIHEVLNFEGPEYTDEQFVAVDFSQVDGSITGTENFRVGDFHELQLIPFRDAGLQLHSARSNDDIGLAHLPRFWVWNREGKGIKREPYPSAPIIMVGNSLQRCGIDFPMLSLALGQRAVSVESGGQTSAYKLAVVSRYCKADIKPSHIILVTWRDCLTLPYYNGLGTKWEKPALKAIGDDTELKDLIYRLTDPGQERYDDFRESVGKSLLPLIIQKAREASIQLIVLRYKTIEYAETPEEVNSEKYLKYVEQLGAYLEKEGIPFFDYSLNPEITLEMYGKGSHFNELGRAAWTPMVAEDLKKVIVEQ